MLRRAPRPLAAAPLAAGGAVSDVVVLPSVIWLEVVVFVAVVVVFVVFVVAGLVLLFTPKKTDSFGRKLIYFD